MTTSSFSLMRCPLVGKTEPMLILAIPDVMSGPDKPDEPRSSTQQFMNNIEHWFVDTYLSPPRERQPRKVRGEKPLPQQHRCASCGHFICPMEVKLSHKHGRQFGVCLKCLRRK